MSSKSITKQGLPGRHKRRALCAAISLSMLPLAGGGLAQEQESVEEVVVTGSFIRRSEGFTGASSVTQLSAEDLIEEGTLNMGEVIQNLVFVNGSASAITNTIQGQDSRSTEIDLRGLGERSTLTLLDGKRLVNENVNALIPTIAIQRLDIVADGAAALYGNEAVAGVVNFVPYKSYDGLKIDSYAEQDSRGDYDEHSMQLLWGGDIGEVDAVVAAQFRANSRLGWDERNQLANSGGVVSNNAPGNWFLPVRDENGRYTGEQVRATDPACRPRSQRTDYQVNQINNPYGMLLGTTCWFDFGDNRSYREPAQTTSYFTNLSWDYSEDLSLSFQGFLTRHAELEYSSTSNPGNSRIGELPAVRGEIPGNPFWATDANGNQLYGVDANGDGIPDRGSEDLNGDGWGDYIVSGTVDNGVPLHEDVRARTLRPINKTHTRPDGHSIDMDNLMDSIDDVGRWTAQADFQVPFLDGWSGMAAYTHNYRELKFTSNQNYDIEAMKTGLRCDVVNARQDCYNPFFVTDESTNNSLHVMNAIAARGREIVEDTLNTVDLVLTGDIAPGGWELPGGPVAAAVGYQFRDDRYHNTPAPVELAGDTWIGGTAKEVVTSGSREVDAYFLELSLPVLSNLEVELAVRNESFSTGQESTDPKYGLTWAPAEWLTLRATQGDAFIAPTLEQLLDPITCGLSTVTDRFGPFEAFTTACGGGNASLENEIAESTQFGFDVNLGDFRFSATWNNTEFRNRIITVTGQDIMELDFANFRRLTGFTGSGQRGSQPTEEQLRSWLANPASNKDIIRAPDDIYTILQVNNTSTANAQYVEVTAYDLQADYRFDTGIGSFRFNLQATNIDEFLYQDDATQPIVDGAGKYNDRTAAAPELPEWKANLRIGWSLGNHAVVAITRYVDGMPYDGPSAAHLDLFASTYRPRGIRETGITAWKQVDATYTYRGLRLFDGEAAFSLGARNLFDREAQRSPEFAGIIGGLQDPLGRVVYARFVYDF